MIKSVAIIALLCGPAFASPESTYRIDLVDKNVKHHVLVSDHTCGEVNMKSPQRESFLKVCVSPTDDKRIKVQVERRTRDKADEARSSATVLATSGTSFDILDAKLTIKTQ